MTILSHSLLSMVMIKGMGLSGGEVMLAVTFGNLVDLDHLPKLWKDKKITQRGHTVIHEPVFALPVWAATHFAHSPVPLLFWGVHMGADHILMRSEKRPAYPFKKNWIEYGWWKLGTKAEWVLDAALIGVLIALWF